MKKLILLIFIATIFTSCFEEPEDQYSEVYATFSVPDEVYDIVADGDTYLNESINYSATQSLKVGVEYKFTWYYTGGETNSGKLTVDYDISVPTIIISISDSLDNIYYSEVHDEDKSILPSFFQ